MTSKKAVFYYSNSGNTKAMIELTNFEGFDVHNFKKLSYWSIQSLLEKYETIIICTPTLGRGVPPVFFQNIGRLLNKLADKKIGLAGSGQTIYGDNFCGALDVLEEFLSANNEIVFKYKFESFPTELARQEFQSIINNIKEINEHGE